MSWRWHGIFGEMTSALLVGLLTAGGPGSGLAWAAWEPPPDPSMGGVSVASDPAGAAVYVNGEYRGASPVSVGRLTPGDHRVTVRKDGYLENRRVVSVQAGSAQAVAVKLTPDVRVRRSTQVEEPQQEGGGGGGKKALLIGLGVVGAGAAAFLVLRNKNSPPVAGTISTSPAVTGIMAVTSFTFISNARDPDSGDTLAYAWNFGDGATSTSPSPTHVYASAGAFSVTLTVTDSHKASATATGSVTVRSLSGSWRGSFSSGFGFTISMTQSGNTLSGNFQNQAGGASPFRGTVSEPRSIRWTYDRFCDFWTGTVSDDVNTINGTTNGCFVSGWTMNRQ